MAASKKTPSNRPGTPKGQPARSENAPKGAASPSDPSDDANSEDPDLPVEIVEASPSDCDDVDDPAAFAEADGGSEGAHATATATDGAPPSRPTALIVPGKRSIAVQDPLQAYINESRRHPLLSREDEHDLAVKYREHGDLSAARRLVTANLRLVVKIAHEYRKACRDLLDLVQEGNVGLMHAVKKFDPYRGVKLSSYAAWWIRAYILKFILNNWRMVKIGTTQNQRKLFFNLKKEIDRLQQLGFDSPGPKLLAENLDVPEHEVTSMQQRLSGNDVSLDAPIGSDDDSSATRLDMVETQNAGPDTEVEDRQFSDLLNQKLSTFGSTLKGRDKEVFELRTVASEPLTLQELGNRYGVTRERARQIERRIMDRLRDYLRQELGDSVDIALGATPPESTD